MTLLLLLNQPAAPGGSATGTAFASFVEAGMIQPDWQIDDYLVATVQTHDSTGQAAAADAVPSYVIRNAATGATVDSGNFAAVAGVDGFYVLRRQLTAAAGFAAMTTYTLRVEALMSTVPAADSGVFRVGAWTEIRGTKNTFDALSGADGDTLKTLSDQVDAISAGAGSGTGTYTDTVTDGANPLDGVIVELSTDNAKANVVYQTRTNASGVFLFHPDPGTYYVWFELAGHNFDAENGAEVVVV